MTTLFDDAREHQGAPSPHGSVLVTATPEGRLVALMSNMKRLGVELSLWHQ